MAKTKIVRCAATPFNDGSVHMELHYEDGKMDEYRFPATTALQLSYDLQDSAQVIIRQRYEKLPHKSRDVKHGNH